MKDQREALREATRRAVERAEQAERELDMALFGARPLVHVFEAVLAEVHRARDVGYHRLVRRAIAEIGGHHLAQVVGMIGEQLHRALDAVLAQRQRFGAHLVVRGALLAQYGFHFGFPVVRHCSLRLILLHRSTRLWATR